MVVAEEQALAQQVVEPLEQELILQVLAQQDQDKQPVQTPQV
jgi:hypothetical protein